MRLPVKLLKYLLTICSFTLLCACSIISGIGKDNAPAPTALTSFQPEVSAKQAWSGSVEGSGVKDYLKLGPVIDNKIFVASPNGEVTAFDANTGARVWENNIHVPITSGPAAGNGLVVVGTSDAQVIALNEGNGAEVWHITVPNALLAAPQIAYDRVIVRTVDGKLVALSLQDGHIIWLYDHGSPILTLRANSVPQIVGNKIVAGFADGKLAAYSLDQGRLLWEQTIAQPQGVTDAAQLVDVVADPVISGDVIFVATYQGKIAAVSLSTGQILWQKDISTYTGLALGRGLLFVTDADSTVWAFNRSNGNVVWKQTQLAYRVITAPVVMDNTLVVADGEGYLHWLSQSDGRTVGRVVVKEKDAIAAPPAVFGNKVYVVTKKGYLSAWQVL